MWRLQQEAKVDCQVYQTKWEEDREARGKRRNEGEHWH